MLAATNTSKDTVAVLINADIILYDDFPYAVRKIRRDFPPGWLAVAARWDVTSLPNSLPVLGPGRRPEEDVRHAVVRHARTKGVLHTYGGIDLWAWDTAAGPLYHGLVPPFVYGRGKYDNWLTHHVIRANKRATVDVSEACTLVHVKHDHHLVSDGAVPLSNWAQSAPLVSDISARNQEFWSTDPRGRFELFINSYLAAAYGSYVTQMGTILHAPLKLTSCYEHDGFCIFQRVRPHTCRCEHSPYVAEAQNDPYIVADSRVIFCGLLSANRGSNPVDAKERWAITGRTDDDGPEGANSTSPLTFGLPLLQDHLLHVIASRTNSEIVFLVVADYSERSLIMELVCSMRTHELFPWLMVAALDDDLYRYCVTRGLPVYLSEFDESGFKDHVNFRELARYQLTYEVLRKGKQVFSIEPSITFFAPLWEYFDSKVTKDIDVAILSRPSTNESIVKDFSYIPSAFVYARPGDRTLDLLKRVMIGLQGHSVGSGMLLRHAACGVNDEGLRNMSRCQLGDRAVVHLLDRELFRAIEETGCKFCGPPVLYYSALFGGNGEPEEAMKALRRTGLSSTVEGQQFCALTMQA
ncbi:glycosyltransferase-like protein similarity to GT77 enzymes [Chondrus crispus]|uniref:Glycosyltransferase-like protein similarity to GT77 enzymes n=1 Tax=Chondrus crispus TaxID=2769 RepID=R7QPH8_CHOCR|nr:glycosyltransferase-like protein similarity to GT77 enzymes [Chondrus crispus]CDF40397.1 glycosyltransferase-like protein similarity to GT77 enzymes [Chondrus crispus]|eukprot:XP_005710691.1 glycosyltransferase-like protein similarity to GT77 enzymes [Chondrus crispus]